MSEFWKSTAPSWLGAGGTVAIAAVAFFTLNPLIENLELRSANHRLTVERDELVLQRGKLVRNLETTENKIGLAKEEFLYLKQRVEGVDSDLTAKRENLKRAQEQVAATQNNNNKLTQMNSEMLETFASQVAERGNLETANNELRRANDELGRTSSDLKGRNVNLERQLENTGSKLRDAQNELEDTRRGQRRYVIVSLVAKAKGFVQPVDGLDAGWRSVHLPVFYDAVAWKGMKSLGKTFPIGPLFAKSQGAIPITGQKDVLGLFSIPEFDLLKETERLGLQREIQDIMEQHPDWYALDLEVSKNTWEAYIGALSEIERLNTARKGMKKIVVAEGEPDRIPNEQDVSQANDAFEAATRAYRIEGEAAHASQEAFREGLDKMNRELIAVGS